MKLILLTILLGILQGPEGTETSCICTPCLDVTGILFLQAQLPEIRPDSAAVPLKKIDKIRASRLYKTLDKLGGYVWILLLVVFAGLIALLRYADRLIRYSDNLMLRVQRRPNIFDSFQFTGNPFILKSPFYAIYHVFLGRCAYRSYLVWPLKYTAAVSILASIVIRLFRDEALIQAPGILTFLESPLSVQISVGLIALLYLAVLVLLIIESIRKTKWFFPLRLIVFLIPAGVIAFLIYILFWLVLGLTVLYLLTHLGRDFITRQKNAAREGYSQKDFIYEPWPDGAENPYSS